MPAWKNRKPKTVMLLLLIVLLPLGASAREDGIHAPIIISGHPDYPPFMWREGDRIVGVCADLANMILTRLGQPADSRFLGPWKRVQENARHGRVDLIAGIYRNIERESYLVFSEPYCEDPTSLFVAKKDMVVENFCFAFSRQSTHKGLLPAINRQIRRLRDEGRIDVLINDNLNRYLRPSH